MSFAFGVFVLFFSLVESATFTNKITSDRQLIVLAPPSKYDPYYKPKFNEIIQFYTNFAKNIIGKDNVVLIADRATMPYFSGKLPRDVLLNAKLRDPRIRDNSYSIPSNPINFKSVGGYKSLFGSLSTSAAIRIDTAYKKFTKKYELKTRNTVLYSDASDIVDNNRDKAVITERFLINNCHNYTTNKYENGKSKFLTATGLNQVAILPEDGRKAAHTDNMVTFLNENALAVNQYLEPFRTSVLFELTQSLPGVKIVEIPYNVGTKNSGSTCGIYVNCVVTNRNIYMPTFNNSKDLDAYYSIILDSQGKDIVQIPIQDICQFGGGLRRFTWQLEGENARKIINAARND